MHSAVTPHSASHSLAAFNSLNIRQYLREGGNSSADGGKYGLQTMSEAVFASRGEPVYVSGGGSPGTDGSHSRDSRTDPGHEDCYGVVKVRTRPDRGNEGCDAHFVGPDSSAEGLRLHRLTSLLQRVF